MDYLHPFSIESRVMDLLDNPDAAEIVKEHVPALYYACGDYYNDTRVLPLVQAASVMSLGSDVIRRMDPFLRKVTI